MYKLGNNENVWSKAVNNDGYLNDKYGALDNPNGLRFPSLSFDLEWKKMPGAKSYAVVIEDVEASSVVGFPFIHWVVLNINDTKLEENASYKAWKKWIDSKQVNYGSEELWQGFNSSVNQTIVANNKQNQALKGILPEAFTSLELNDAAIYFGPYPPNKDHVYTVTVYGLDKKADELEYTLDFEKQNKAKLHKPFYVGDFYQAINDSVVNSYILNFKYKKVG